MDFDSATAGFRRELLAHCYRLTGSVDDAEDLVQETYLRAWRAWSGFEGRSSVRTWLYRIATNACLTAVQHRSRRVLPSGLGAPTDDPDAQPVAADAAWLQPLPDVLIFDDPAEIAAARDSLRLALIASLQFLPPRQRAVLLLRDVLAFPAADVAEMLDTSVTAVKSTLQRARARAAELVPEDVSEPTDAELRALLDRYIAAFENADAAGLEQILRQDAVLEVTGSSTWFSGRKTCLPYLADHILERPGEYRMLPVGANGQPAAATYLHGQAFGLAVLTGAADGLARITVFMDPALVARYGLPLSLG